MFGGSLTIMRHGKPPQIILAPSSPKPPAKYRRADPATPEPESVLEKIFAGRGIGFRYCDPTVNVADMKACYICGAEVEERKRVWSDAWRSEYMLSLCKEHIDITIDQVVDLLNGHGPLAQSGKQRACEICDYEEEEEELIECNKCGREAFCSENCMEQFAFNPSDGRHYCVFVRGAPSEAPHALPEDTE